MTALLERNQVSIGYAEICAFLYREARLLDDRDWDAWLDCYSPDVDYWMPAWTDDDELTRDPQSEISLIYYPNRQGLEDRVYRLKTGRSSASLPEARTTHTVNNVELLDRNESEITLRYNWHTLSHRMRETSQYFGTIFCTLKVDSDDVRITKKMIVLKNDYIHQVIDIYHV